jgi:hypothetical protein
MIERLNNLMIKRFDLEETIWSRCFGISELEFIIRAFVAKAVLGCQ